MKRAVAAIAGVAVAGVLASPGSAEARQINHRDVRRGAIAYGKRDLAERQAAHFKVGHCKIVVRRHGRRGVCPLHETGIRGGWTLDFTVVVVAAGPRYVKVSSPLYALAPMRVRR